MVIVHLVMAGMVSRDGSVGNKKIQRAFLSKENADNYANTIKNDRGWYANVSVEELIVSE